MNANEARGLQQPPWLPRNFQSEAIGGCCCSRRTSLEHGRGAAWPGSGPGGRKWAGGSSSSSSSCLGLMFGALPLPNPAPWYKGFLTPTRAIFLPGFGWGGNERMENPVSAGEMWDGMWSRTRLHKPCDKSCPNPIRKLGGRTCNHSRGAKSEGAAATPGRHLQISFPAPHTPLDLLGLAKVC